MERNLEQLDFNILSALYDKEVEALHARLLSGTSWEETFSQRRLVTEIAIAMNQRTASRSNLHPAERAIRSEGE